MEAMQFLGMELLQLAQAVAVLAVLEQILQIIS
jgi:hypothetical protein